ncbi:unnamed protein product, partial [Urochloa humidicola]
PRSPFQNAPTHASATPNFTQPPPAPNEVFEELLRQAVNPVILSSELRHGALTKLREDLWCWPPTATRLQPASLRGKANMVMAVEGASFEDLENQDLIIGSNYTLMTYENCGLLSVRMDVIL